MLGTRLNLAFFRFNQMLCSLIGVTGASSVYLSGLATLRACLVVLLSFLCLELLITAFGAFIGGAIPSWSQKLLLLGISIFEMSVMLPVCSWRRA